MRNLKRNSVAIVLLALAACYPSHYREARGQKPESLAKIRVQGALTVTAINGRKVEIPGLAILPRRWDDFFVEPGTYSVRVLFLEQRDERAVFSGKFSEVRMDLKPGEIRYICPGVEFNRLGRVKAVKPYVAEFENFSPSRYWWLVHHVRPKAPAECR